MLLPARWCDCDSTCDVELWFSRAHTSHSSLSPTDTSSRRSDVAQRNTEAHCAQTMFGVELVSASPSALRSSRSTMCRRRRWCNRATRYFLSRREDAAERWSVQLVAIFCDCAVAEWNMFCFCSYLFLSTVSHHQCLELLVCNIQASAIVFLKLKLCYGVK